MTVSEVLESVIKKTCWLIACPVLALPFIHPFGPVKQQRSANLLPSAQSESSQVLPLLEKACQDCHSRRTHWPAYSYLPFLSWPLERDVAEARQHMDLSQWDRYSADQKRDLLARIGAEVRSRQMPPPRYQLLHPQARLSEAEIQIIYDWAKAERRANRNQRE
jgi:cytochrome c